MAPVLCLRCGHRSVLSSGPFCPHCGNYLAPLRWVAEPPASALPPPEIPKRRVPYTGAPRYRFIPRWGFPPLPWRPEPEAGAAAVPGSLHKARSVVATAVPLLWATAAVALIAAGAEIWRYVLLVQSREGALSATAVAASDALVAAAGRVAPVLAVLSGVLVVYWSVQASAAAAEQAGVLPSRSMRAIVIGWVVPGLNLVVPGAVFAEIEHTALARPPDLRPQPSRLLLVWWGLFAFDVVLAAVVYAWSFRTGVQAMADGVVLHALLDMIGAATAAVTVLVVVHLTRLLGPVRAPQREVLVSTRP
ncbi:DUF4328 domain-containing protein [Pseudonocardia sp. TRM90224]|uniref:DUF4328 domain-containing protein n=1 Tax=Pseudonocardia sp. TRM90224 TaxID=2812678 RepID=UPI001E5473DE|nr:DUF4328 domain-containing protein [Pseudonocardia sp. TRM90224]